MGAVPQTGIIMTNMSDWQARVGASWAQEWQRTDRSFSGLTDRLLGAASAGPVTRALDIGCGAGELSLAMARGHPGAEIIGLDVSSRLIDVAKERGRHLPYLTFEMTDASLWSRSDFAPDLLFSRHGVMFFEDPAAAFGNLARIGVDDCRLVFSCFRSAEENPWAVDIMDLLRMEPPSPPTHYVPGPFAFADRAYVSALLEQSGWAQVAFERVDYAYVAGTGDNAVDDAIDYFLAIGPAARAAAGLDDEQRTHFIGRLHRYLASHEQGGIVALPAAAWIVSAKVAAR